MAEGFDLGATFNENYLYFYAERLSDDASDADAAVVWDVARLSRGVRVLDLACGHGRIANRLAARGASVCGVDATPLFVALAKEDATRRGVSVDYREGDMRSLPWRAEFDAVFSWFTSFGYFDDNTNRHILGEVLRVLRPGGRFVLHLNHRDALMAIFSPSIVVERDGDVMIDRNRFDPYTGRAHTQRIMIRDGQVFHSAFFVRLFSFTELRDWLLEAGFATVEGFGDDGDTLTASSRRLVVRATRASE